MSETPARKKSTTATPVADDCPDCRGYGYIIDDATNTARPCGCGLAKRTEARSRQRQAGIPTRFATKDFQNFTIAKGDRDRELIRKLAHSYAVSFNTDESQGLLLRGIPGSGKTHIAVAILREVISRGHSGRFENFSDLLSRIRETWHRESEASEGDLLEIVDQADLLVLDDLGAESVADWVRDRLYLILNRRYENARPVIITTNCSEEELMARVGHRISSRLYEMCALRFPVFPAVDWRQANMR